MKEPGSLRRTCQPPYSEIRIPAAALKRVESTQAGICGWLGQDKRLTEKAVSPRLGTAPPATRQTLLGSRQVR